MPKLDLTPWQPGAVFYPITSLCFANDKADRLMSEFEEIYNAPTSDDGISRIVGASARESDSLIYRVTSGNH